MFLDRIQHMVGHELGHVEKRTYTNQQFVFVFRAKTVFFRPLFLPDFQTFGRGVQVFFMQLLINVHQKHTC